MRTTAPGSRLTARQVATTSSAGLLLAVASPLALACPACVPLVEAGIYGENFLLHLVLMTLPVVVLVAFAVGVYKADRFFVSKEKKQ